MDVLFCNFVDRGRRLCSLRRTGGLVRSRDPTSATTTAGTEAGTSTPAEPGRD